LPPDVAGDSIGASSVELNGDPLFQPSFRLVTPPFDEATFECGASSRPGDGCSGGDRGCLDGLRHASYVGDVDLVGFGLFGHRDGDGEHSVMVNGVDVVTVQAFAQ
jgi:hypothetical protein